MTLEYNLQHSQLAPLAQKNLYKERYEAMKVTVNDQLITRPKLLKPIEPGFQNFGKDVKINNRGQLVTRSAKAKELKKSFGMERGFKDLGYQNIDLNDKSSNFSNIGLKDRKESKFGYQNIDQNDKNSIFSNLDLKDKKESKLGFQNAEVKGNKFVTPPGQLVSQNAIDKGNRPVNPPAQLGSQNAKGKRTVTPPEQTVSQDVGQKGRSVNTLA